MSEDAAAWLFRVELQRWVPGSELIEGDPVEFRDEIAAVGLVIGAGGGGIRLIVSGTIGQSPGSER